MERLTWMLAGMLRRAAGLLPPGRRQWAEAVRAEAGQVPAGWPRLRWLAGGLWLASREGAKTMAGKVVYRLGAVAVAALAAWAVWLSWRASPAADPQAVTDRVRVLVGVAALVVLPWAGRRRGWFGPVRSSMAARLVRLAGCAAVCGLGTAVVRMDSHMGLGPHGPGPFSLPREVAALVLLGAALAARAVGKARWPDADPIALWAAPGTTGDPQELREARIRQGLLAGLAAGAACGLLLTHFFVAAVFMMVLGPLLGAAGGAVGGAVAADHPRRSRPARSWSAGLFVSHW